MKRIDAKLPGNTKNAVGIDPGINFGLTIIKGEDVTILWGKIETSKVPGHKGIHAYDLMLDIDWGTVCPAVVEGAAYNKYYGQVTLEEVRFAIFLSLYHQGFDVTIVPPATIRAAVFESGKQQAGDVWPLLNHNAADSLGVALYLLQEV